MELTGPMRRVLVEHLAQAMIEHADELTVLDVKAGGRENFPTPESYGHVFKGESAQDFGPSA